MRYLLKRSLLIGTLLTLTFITVFQPLFTAVAQAQVATTPINIQANSTEATQIVGNETPATSINNMFADWNTLGWVTDITSSQPGTKNSVLSLSAQDQAMIQICQDPATTGDCKLDVRAIDYLTNLVAPVDQGGQGLPFVQANILKGYTTNGIGKYDRETLAQSEGDNLVSGHNTGKAVDITEVGQITCKIVEKRHGILGVGGGDTTKWQAATPVKVAWQSTSGINSIPTPNANSLIGNAQSMTADGLRQYLNDGGNLDAALDYIKGLDLQTISQYVGANILLKDLGAKNVSSDPFSGDIVSSLGYALISSALPDLPTGALSGSQNDEFRTALGKAGIEQKLGLPSGSLANLGWDNVLATSGKRLLEQTFGLPAGYLDKYSLNDFNKQPGVVGATSYVSQTDTSLNLVNGTIAKLKANDQSGFKLAGVKIIESAFKLSDAQKTLLEQSVSKGALPSIDPTTFPTGSAMSVAGIFGIFSNDSTAQNKAIDELRQLGAGALSQAVSKNLPTTISGLSQTIIDYLINQNKNFSVGDLAKQAGAAQLMNQAGLNGEDALRLIANPNTAGYNSAIASLINQTLQLPNNGQLSASDVNNMLNKGDYSVLLKIGAAELDKGIGWNVGTGAKVISGQEKLTDAVQEVFTNSIAGILGIPGGTFGINGDTSLNVAASIIEHALGIPSGSLQNITNAAGLGDKIGLSDFSKIFGVNPSNNSSSIWSDPAVVQIQATVSNRLGIPTASLQAFLQNKLSFGDLAKQTLDTYTADLTPDKLKSYFNLQDQYVPSADVLSTLVALVKNNGVITTTVNGKTVTIDRKQDAINNIYALIGATVDSGANYNIDAFRTYITSNDPNKGVNILLDQGISLFTRSIGLSAGDANYLKGVADQLKTYFNGGGGNLQNILISFFAKATGVPQQYATDMQASFLKGDFTTGLYEMSFVLWSNEANKYLPPDAQLSYQDLKNTIQFNDPGIISAKVTQLAKDNGVTDVKSIGELNDVARKQLMNEYSKDAQYKISDAFLRKSDPTIPAGFSKVMMQGSDVERTQMLQKFALSTLESQLTGNIPGYRVGMLNDMLNGNGDAKTRDILQLIAANSNIHLGPMSSTDTQSLILYFTSSSSKQQNYFTDGKYQPMWRSLDGWMASVTGINGIPAGAAEALIFAGKNNWDFNASLKDSKGNVLVHSVKDLGQSLLVNTVTNWADKQFGFAPGTTMQFYQAYQSYQAGNKDAVIFHLAVAIGGKDAAKYVQLYQSFKQDPYSTVINYVISSCASCQKLFSQVDSAIQAPPGFTNQLVQGLVLFIFTGNPIGLIQAAMTYFFGVYKIEYLCPVPPSDPYAQNSFDVGTDQISYGYSYNPGTDPQPSSTPAPGQSVGDWSKTVQFADGNNQNLWIMWARYYTGRVLNQTLAYAGEQPQIDKPRQVLTYRRANAEYFQALNDQIAAAFGQIENNNAAIGLGYTQDSTRTADHIHVGFGGF